MAQTMMQLSGTLTQDVPAQRKQVPTTTSNVVVVPEPILAFFAEEGAGDGAKRPKKPLTKGSATIRDNSSKLTLALGR